MRATHNFGDHTCVDACHFRFVTMAATVPQLDTTLCVDDERVDETKFHIEVEPTVTDVAHASDHSTDAVQSPVSPFRRGEAYASDRFLAAFLAASQPGSKVPSPVSTAPATPNIADPPTPPQPNGTSTILSSPETVAVLEFLSYDHDTRSESDQTPCNTRTGNTPDMSKRSTRDRFGLSTLKRNANPEDAPPSSMIVPIVIPDIKGSFVSDEKKTMNSLHPNMATHFAILVTDYKHVFHSPPMKPTTLGQSTFTQTSTTPTLHRRRSMTFLNVNPSSDEPYLTIERNEATPRVRSAQLPDVQVRLLVSLNDIKKRGVVRMHGPAFELILKESMNRLTRPPQRYQGELLDIYLQQTFIPCQTLTVLCRQFVMEPLRTKDGTIMSVSGADNILGNMYVQGWLDTNGEPTIGFYSDDRATLCKVADDGWR